MDVVVRVDGLGMQGFRFWFWLRVWGWVVGLGIPGSGFGVSGHGFRVECSECGPHTL